MFRKDLPIIIPMTTSITTTGIPSLWEKRGERKIANNIIDKDRIIGGKGILWRAARISMISPSTPTIYPSSLKIMYKITLIKVKN